MGRISWRTTRSRYGTGGVENVTAIRERQSTTSINFTIIILGSEI